MKILGGALCLALVLLQYRLWLSEHGMREVARLQSVVAAQTAANREQAERNRQLVAEVADLKVGMTALEERARSELDMISSNETYYQVVQPKPDAPRPPAAQVAAR